MGDIVKASYMLAEVVGKRMVDVYDFLVNAPTIVARLVQGGRKRRLFLRRVARSLGLVKVTKRQQRSKGRRGAVRVRAARVAVPKTGSGASPARVGIQLPPPPQSVATPTGNSAQLEDELSKLRSEILAMMNEESGTAAERNERNDSMRSPAPLPPPSANHAATPLPAELPPPPPPFCGVNGAAAPSMTPVPPPLSAAAFGLHARANAASNDTTAMPPPPPPTFQSKQQLGVFNAAALSTATRMPPPPPPLGDDEHADEYEYDHEMADADNVSAQPRRLSVGAMQRKRDTLRRVEGTRSPGGTVRRDASHRGYQAPIDTQSIIAAALRKKFATLLAPPTPPRTPTRLSMADVSSARDEAATLRDSGLFAPLLHAAWPQEAQVCATPANYTESRRRVSCLARPNQQDEEEEEEEVEDAEESGAVPMDADEAENADGNTYVSPALNNATKRPLTRAQRKREQLSASNVSGSAKSTPCALASDAEQSEATPEEMRRLFSFMNEMDTTVGDDE